MYFSKTNEEINLSLSSCATSLAAHNKEDDDDVNDGDFHENEIKTDDNFGNNENPESNK